MALSEKKRALIEKIGVHFEFKGMQPLFGRIIGLMLVHERAEVTFEEIVDELNVSKSAVSNALTFLQATGKVAYHTKPGDRKRYFHLPMKDFTSDMEKELMEIVKFEEVLEEVLVERGETNADFNCSLKEFLNFIKFIKMEIPVLIEKYKRQKGL
ncbi:GbsR/MarR family transcriptional regulator [Belliella kenyensis]|uniref:GbsR/MarR family transcriptional regulator n=1 Tax=Belliella kenyensis TaxID=1472724 RepID=A0ABV8EIY0_9BACT|nr:HTH domain-containing protein [Belliella kenyensis]MCH7400317.1 HTH domain-containing protein [Belliella kenyensis]MDN3604665.1 HTH domain-containing protein [Belliella kenyensis]